MATKYDTDFYGWTQEQAAKLRALLAEQSNLDLDMENIAEEIESLGKRDKLMLGRRLAELDTALMKLAFSLAWEPRRQWRLTALGQRHAIKQVLKDSPSLHEWLRGELPDSHDYALITFDEAKLIRLGMSEPPATCPFDLDDMLDTNWWPEPRGADDA